MLIREGVTANNSREGVPRSWVSNVNNGGLTFELSQTPVEYLVTDGRAMVNECNRGLQTLVSKAMASTTCNGNGDGDGEGSRHSPVVGRRKTSKQRVLQTYTASEQLLEIAKDEVCRDAGSVARVFKAEFKKITLNFFILLAWILTPLNSANNNKEIRLGLTFGEFRI